MTENEISYIIRGAIFEVYNELGPGLMERIYEQALYFELTQKKLRVEKQVPIPVIYKGVDMDIGYRLDLIVEDKVIIEIKSVENLAGTHHKQLLTYLKLLDMRLGILVNFNESNISSGIYRKVNQLSVLN